MRYAATAILYPFVLLGMLIVSTLSAFPLAAKASYLWAVALLSMGNNPTVNNNS